MSEKTYIMVDGENIEVVKQKRDEYLSQSDMFESMDKMPLDPLLNFLTEAKRQGAQFLSFDFEKDYENVVEGFEVSPIVERDETDDEAAQRTEAEYRNRRALQNLNENRERAAYERLKKKYEGK